MCQRRRTNKKKFIPQFYPKYNNVSMNVIKYNNQGPYVWRRQQCNKHRWGKWVPISLIMYNFFFVVGSFSQHTQCMTRDMRSYHFHWISWRVLVVCVWLADKGYSLIFYLVCLYRERRRQFKESVSDSNFMVISYDLLSVLEVCGVETSDVTRKLL